MGEGPYRTREENPAPPGWEPSWWAHFACKIYGCNWWTIYHPKAKPGFCMRCGLIDHDTLSRDEVAEALMQAVRWFERHSRAR